MVPCIVCAAAAAATALWPAGWMGKYGGVLHVSTVLLVRHVMVSVILCT